MNFSMPATIPQMGKGKVIWGERGRREKGEKKRKGSCSRKLKFCLFVSIVKGVLSVVKIFLHNRQIN